MKRLILISFLILSLLAPISIIGAPTTFQNTDLTVYSSAQESFVSQGDEWKYYLWLNFTAPGSPTPFLILAHSIINGAATNYARLNNTGSDSESYIGYTAMEFLYTDDYYSFNTMAVRNYSGSQNLALSHHATAAQPIYSRKARIMAIQLSEYNHYYFAQNETQGSTSGASWLNQTILNFEVNSTNYGYHLFIVSSELRAAAFGGHRVNLRQNGGSPEEISFMNFTPNSISTTNPYTIKVKNLVAANYSLTTEFCNFGASTTLINRSRIFVLSLRGFTPDLHYIYEESESVSQSTTTTHALKVNSTYSPFKTGTYLFLGSHERNCSSAHGIEIFSYNETYQTSNNRIWNTGEQFQNYGFMKPEILNSSMSNLGYNISFARIGASGTGEIRRARIFVWLPQYWLPITRGAYNVKYIIGLVGLILMVAAPTYGVWEVKHEKNYYGLMSALIIFIIGYAFVVCWLV